MALSNDEMPPHPDLNAIAAFADGRLPARDRAVLVDHLAGCAECRTTLAALARGLAGTPQLRRRFQGPAAWLSLAATLTLATAGTLVWRANLQAPAPAPAPSSMPTTTVTAPAAGAPPAPGSAIQPPRSAAAGTPPIDERRGATRQVNGKTFRLVAGEWIDASYDPIGLLPVERIGDAQARTAILARVPALKPFADLGPRVLVIHDGVVYRFSLP